eukprot:TRINITY_DN39615_c0_g1_i1.p1 TRINITY_DN39615_c0_g1~~TRINITY_DN39615_c0_g1_i1.p1  ORF type:complete len:110 (-),score=9.65 TRINITY_DN39615_c0_g1_i1:223-522(-)
MRGILSEGMVLVASQEAGETKQLELLTPPEASQPGDKVFFEGYQDGEPEAQLPPKKKIWESIQPHLNTNSEFQAQYKSAQMKTHRGPVTCNSISAGTIS